MFNRIWKWAGKHHTSDRNLGREWPRIPEGMRVLLDDVHYWDEHATYPVTEIAVRLHHRMVVIHPWPNGNGRPTPACWPTSSSPRATERRSPGAHSSASPNPASPAPVTLPR